MSAASYPPLPSRYPLSAIRLQPIHLPPAARQHRATLPPLAAVIAELAEAQAHVAFAAEHAQRLAGRHDGHRGQRFLAEAAFFDGMPKILLPLPRGSSGRSATGNTSSRPSVFTAATSAPSTAGTGTGGEHRRALRHLQHRLAGPVATVQVLELDDEAVAGVAGQQPSAPRGRRSARPGTWRRRADRAGPTAARPGRAPTAACAPAGCRRARCCRGTPPAACCGRAPRPGSSSPVL